MDRTMEELRGDIDRIDGQLVELLKARMEASEQMGSWKRHNGRAVLAPDRERRLLDRVGGLSGPWQEPVEAVYREILRQSRGIQKSMGCGVYGLIGEHLQHSFSPRLHGLLGNRSYGLFELQPEELEAFLTRGAFDGLNVTIPYKKAVIPYCSRLTDQARRIGSVNTIVRQPDGTLLGHNTDYDGFLHLLRISGIEAAGKKVLVLGSGGASLTVQTVLEDLGAGEIVVISRSGPDHYGNLDRHRDAAILVNATPVGMYPHNGESLVDLDRLPKLEYIFDLIYNPAKTRLLLDGERRGIPGAGGLAMLAAQAKAAAELFWERALPEELTDRVTRQLEWDTQNLILVGMPGCGKSSLGRMLAKKLDRPFVDLDENVAARAGMSIPELFQKQGEEIFRRLEHEALCEATALPGQVIATGGGVVTRPENMDPLRQNGRVIYLCRPVEELPRTGRPLSAAGDLNEMLTVRGPLYDKASDLTVDNVGIEETAEEIIRRLEP